MDRRRLPSPPNTRRRFQRCSRRQDRPTRPRCRLVGVRGQVGIDITRIATSKGDQPIGAEIQVSIDVAVEPEGEAGEIAAGQVAIVIVHALENDRCAAVPADILERTGRVRCKETHGPWRTDHGAAIGRGGQGRERRIEILGRCGAAVVDSGNESLFLDRRIEDRLDCIGVRRTVRPAYRDGIRAAGRGLDRLHQETVAGLAAFAKPTSMLEELRISTFGCKAAPGSTTIVRVWLASRLIVKLSVSPGDGSGSGEITPLASPRRPTSPSAGWPSTGRETPPWKRRQEMNHESSASLSPCPDGSGRLGLPLSGLPARS